MILYEKGSTTAEASGTTFTLQDTSNERKLSFKKYYGNTTQEGTPTPSSPQPINVVTGGNTISVNNGDNLFDINWLKCNDITVENGVASGTSQSFYNNFSKNNSFIPYTNYRNQIAVSIDAYTDGNASTSGNGLIIYIYYTDGTYNSVVFANNQTTKATKTLISNVNKVVDKLTFSYSSQGSNIWHVSNFMVVYGNEVKPYKEYTGKQYQINLGKNLFDKNNATFKDNYYLNGSGVETYNTAYVSLFLSPGDCTITLLSTDIVLLLLTKLVCLGILSLPTFS